MPQGFTFNRHQTNSDEMERWAFYKHTMDRDQLPDHPDILPLIINALLGRIRRMDRSKGRGMPIIATQRPSVDVAQMRKVARMLLSRIRQLDRTKNKDLARRIKIYIGIIAQRCRYPGEVEVNLLYGRHGHYDDLFEEELKYIEKERLVPFSCIPGVLELQRNVLYGLMNSYWFGYKKDDTPRSWLNREHKEIYETLAFYRCSCVYNFDLSMVDFNVKGPGELIPAILAGLHKGSTASSIRQILKKSSRPSKLPRFLA